MWNGYLTTLRQWRRDGHGPHKKLALRKVRSLTPHSSTTSSVRERAFTEERVKYSTQRQTDWQISLPSPISLSCLYSESGIQHEDALTEKKYLQQLCVLFFVKNYFYTIESLCLSAMDTAIRQEHIKNPVCVRRSKGLKFTGLQLIILYSTPVKSSDPLFSLLSVDDISPLLRMNISAGERFEWWLYPRLPST